MREDIDARDHVLGTRLQGRVAIPVRGKHDRHATTEHHQVPEDVAPPSAAADEPDMYAASAGTWVIAAS